MKENFEKLLDNFGKEISGIIKEKFYEKDITEIRLCAGYSIKIITPYEKVSVGKKLSAAEIKNIFASICDYSVHTYKEDICRGFITICGGYRIGICGTAVYEKGKIINIKNISALNIRIPHEIINSADNILKICKNGGILIIGPPCSGKTTILRDIARQKSKNNLITIVDERMEIAAADKGEPAFDVGESMVLNNFDKSDGIKIAVRTLAPDYIVCDEFGDENDLKFSVYAMKSGVKIIASIHAFDKNDFLSKPLTDKILKYDIFDYFVFLNKKFEICEIIKSGDFK